MACVVITRTLAVLMTVAVGIMTLQLKAFSDTYNWHALLSFISYPVLMAHGLIVYKTTNMTFAKQKDLHGALTGAAFVLATIAFALAYYGKKAVQIHFTTQHGFIGLVVYLILVIQIIGASLLFHTNLLSKSFKDKLIPLHRRTGLFIFLASSVAIITGLSKISYTKIMENHEISATLVSNAVILVFTIYVFSILVNLMGMCENDLQSTRSQKKQN